jgi:hypothetical protein
MYLLGLLIFLVSFVNDEIDEMLKLSVRFLLSSIHNCLFFVESLSYLIIRKYISVNSHGSLKQNKSMEMDELYHQKQNFI